MPINPRANKEIYESFEMLHPSGEFMAFVSSKRANWYIKKDLADWTSEKQFKLRFAPKGDGKKDMPFYTQRLENRCVVCGYDGDDLNKHHVVPYVFRSRFPSSYKENNHHDVLITCIDCHEKYENHAMNFKVKLVKDAGIVMNHKMSAAEKFNRKIMSAKNVINKINSGDIPIGKMPKEKYLELFELSKMAAVPVDIASHTFWADELMKKINSEEDLFSFVKIWRQHFLDYAKPKFLPEHWSVEHPLERSSKVIDYL